MNIQLTQGQITVVDPVDYRTLCEYSWYAVWAPGTQSFYAARTSSRTLGRQYMIPMHRMILGLEKGDKRQGDHINHDTLDNRRCNLRIATCTENLRNQRTPKNNTSGFRGVCKIPGRGKSYRAVIKVGSKQIYLGSRPTAEAAYLELYVPALAAHHGEFACFE